MPTAARSVGRSALAVLIASGAAVAAPPAEYTTLAVTGAAAPGLKGVTFQRLNGLTLNDSGQWVLHAVLAGTGVTTSNDGSVWSNRSGSLALEYREGDPSPIETYSLTSMAYPALNGQGTIGLTSAVSLTPPVTSAPTMVGVFVESAPGVLATVAADTQPAPGIDPPANFASILPAPLALTNLTAINANLGRGIWWDRPGALELVTGFGQAAPDIDGATFAHLDPVSQNHEGGVVFRARVQGAGITSSTNSGLWVAGGGITRLLARTGDPAPGFGDGVVIAELALKPGTDATAAATFRARVSGPGIGPGSDQVIYTTRRKDPLTPLARSGDAAPGAGDDAVYHSFGGVAVNDAGDAAYIARLAGASVTSGNNFAVYVFPASADEPRLVAREGDAVSPGSGLVYTQFVGPALNGFGRVAMLARVAGEGITSANNLWLVAEAPDGRLVRVAATGEAFEVAPGDVRTVRDIGFEGGDPKEGHGQFTFDSTLAFRLNFTDFSDALVTARVACGPDWNADGVINSTDVSDFINDWFADQASGTLATDFNFDGTSNSTDVSDFINAWFGGCDGY